MPKGISAAAAHLLLLLLEAWRNGFLVPLRVVWTVVLAPVAEIISVILAVK